MQIKYNINVETDKAASYVICVINAYISICCASLPNINGIVQYCCSTTAKKIATADPAKLHNNISLYHFGNFRPFT